MVYLNASIHVRHKLIRSIHTALLASFLSFLVHLTKVFWNINYLLTQVSSGVPEGKGVSSSAAIEVASMTAVAAAHGTTFICRIPCSTTTTNFSFIMILNLYPQTTPLSQIHLIVCHILYDFSVLTLGIWWSLSPTTFIHFVSHAYIAKLFRLMLNLNNARAVIKILAVHYSASQICVKDPNFERSSWSKLEEVDTFWFSFLC